MCGIVGFVGGENFTAKEIIIDGLSRLEYRGYDSAGIALAIDGKIDVRKAVGKLSELEAIIDDPDYESSVGMGHTRWATHGAPSVINAHPHVNGDKKVAVVHNGILENYQELKKWLIEDYGCVFVSETDTEVIAHMIGVLYTGDLLETVNLAVAIMRGAYAVLVMHADEPDKIVAVRKDAPLVAGVGEGCNFLASDIPALLKYCREVKLIENNETVVVTKDSIEIFGADDHKPVERETMHIAWDVEDAQKGGYDHFMLKEINEQPKGIADTLLRRLDENGNIVLDGISLTKEDIEGFDKVYIVACGTAYHAGLIGKRAIEKMVKIPVLVDVASEFRYGDPFVDEKTLFIAITQSGETLDTLHALREAKERGARILSVVNVVGSSIARESDDVFYTWAGPEISVASTKAYTTQLMTMYMLALYMGKTKGTISDEEYRETLEELKQLPDKLASYLEKQEDVKQIASRFYRENDMFFIGRGLDSSVALEGSLKMKEISYINSFAIAAGELKHGTIALIENGTLVVVLATQDRLFEKTVSNIQEVKARGAYVIAITKESNEAAAAQADEIITIPDCPDELTPILSVVPLQLFAYFVSLLRGNDVDQPRNLAKSVTVE